MAETRTPMRPVLVQYKCDECGSPVTHRHRDINGLHHKCTGCGKDYWLVQFFPRTEYVREATLDGAIDVLVTPPMSAQHIALKFKIMEKDDGPG